MNKAQQARIEKILKVIEESRFDGVIEHTATEMDEEIMLCVSNGCLDWYEQDFHLVGFVGPRGGFKLHHSRNVAKFITDRF